MKKKLAIALLLLLSAAVSSTGEPIEVRNVGELVKPADLIARVVIISVYDTGATEGYSKIALAHVRDAVKGIDNDQVFMLEHDAAGIACPNVYYKAGEDVLIFAKKLPNGHYHTLYADTGKFPIQDERIDKSPFPKDQSYSAARAEIRRELKKFARAATPKQ